MRIVVNGKEEFLDRPMTIEELRSARSWDAKSIVVELNLEIIDKETWGTTVLKDSDQLEILRFVGGGR